MSSRNFIRTGVLLVGLGWAYWQAPTAVQRLRAWWSPQRASASDANPARDAAWEDLKRQARKRQEAKALAKQNKTQQGVTDVVLYAPGPKNVTKEQRAMLVSPSKRSRTTNPGGGGGKSPAQDSGRGGSGSAQKSNPAASDAESEAAANRSEAAHDPSDNAARGVVGDGADRDRGAGDPAGVAVPARVVGDGPPRNPYRSISRTTEPGGQPILAAGQPDLAALWAAGRPFAVRAYSGRARPFAVIGPPGSALGSEPTAPGAPGTDSAVLTAGSLGADDESPIP